VENSALRIPELDGIRGIAILLVMLYHFRVFFPGASIFNIGWAGVDLFFVLSGFLITEILIRSKSDENYFLNFYARRACRILPLYYMSLICVFLLRPHLMSSGMALSYWLHVSNWTTAFAPNVPIVSHFWSLAIEEQFYLVWPLVVWLTPAKHLTKICIGLAALSFIGRNMPWTLHMQAAYPEFAYRLTLFRVEPLLIGAALATLQLSRQKAWSVFGVGTALISIVLIVSGMSATSIGMTRFGFTGLALTFTGLIALRSKWMTFAPLRFLGKYSYALYVIHAPLTGVVKHRLGGILGFSVAWIASIVLALLSWNLLEKHFLKLKDRFHPVALKRFAVAS
jgi:peptidoglycan/LPS O-acetylase OafA/YrhL